MKWKTWMKVKDLIEHLKEFSQEANVYIDLDENSMAEVKWLYVDDEDDVILIHSEYAEDDGWEDE